MMLFTGSLLAFLFISYVLFVNYYPSFGGDVSKERQTLYQSSKQFSDGKFKNTVDVPKDPSFSETLKIARKFFFEKVENGRPNRDIMVERLDSANIAVATHETRLVWFGHSAFLLQMGGKNILIDPMLSDVPAPHQWMGGNRFSKELPLDIAQLPHIDAVLISHDHYDHLDYHSILAT